MENLSTDGLLRFAVIMAQDVIGELDVADSAINLMIHDDSVPLEIRGKLSLLVEQVRRAAVPAKRIIMRSHAQGDLSVCAVHLNEFFVDLSGLFRRLLPQSIALEMNLPSDLWPTRLNAAFFENACITLVARARDVMPGGGTLLIQARNVDERTSRSISQLYLSGDHVLIEITDNGIGIAPGDLERTFDPFFITKTPANGFALAKVYSTIANTGGQIWVKSAVSEGTTFSVLLPRFVPEEQRQILATG
jgi:two-component system, cell cycle sensor histidine kinase and response regulator CckA